MPSQASVRLARAAGTMSSHRALRIRTGTLMLKRSQSTAAAQPVPPSIDIKTLIPPYERLASTLAAFRRAKSRSMGVAEKILYGHLEDPLQEVVPGKSYLKLKPDRVAMQDASAQMALLQFMLARLQTTAVPTSIHCDHLIVAHKGPSVDLPSSIAANKEIFDFLQSAAERYGIAFWKPGSGIIHQIVLENYAAPGGLMLGTDSHTPNAGGLGMLAIGVGGADAVDAMAGIAWELKAPEVIGVRLTGQLQGWAAPKDVVLSLVGKLTVQGGTGHIIEYFGPGVESLSCTGMATICNMGAEMGATCSVFPFTDAMDRYLRMTNRAGVADAAQQYKDTLLRPDDGRPEDMYSKIVEIDLTTLEPHLNGPFTPDRAFPISQFAAAVKENQWPVKLSAALIGSCTNSSYEDMTRAASIAKQAADKGLKAKTQLLMTPGSTLIQKTIERDGIEQSLSAVGGELLANACGPCIGQWKRTDGSENEANAIVTSFNRNFARRNDGNAKTLNFLASPEIVTAMAFGGSTTFNPLTDTLQDKDGNPFRFSPPKGEELPSAGFALYDGDSVYQPPVANPARKVVVKADSTRLQLLEPFPQWVDAEITDMPVLIKVTGKCTTDHISAAGPWLKYKGHLENISENTLITAVNAENNKPNSVYCHITGEYGTIPEVARRYAQAGRDWLVIGDENYGEGSAREHAAMQPRFLGARVIASKSFARIHETNLKKQGILPLWFETKADYDVIHPRATVSTEGLASLAVGSPVTLHVRNPDGAVHKIRMRHTLSADQLGWIKAGSALNLIAQAQQQ